MKKIVTTLFYIICVIQITTGQYSGAGCIIKSEFIYQPADVPFPSCHASTIIGNGKGLMAAWFGGTAERNPDVGIWVSRYEKGKWSIPVEVADGVQHKEKRYPCWNPVLFNTGNEILLFYKVGPSPSTWWGELITSSNKGKKWSVPRRLPEDIFGPIKNKPVLISGGELLCPSSTEDEGWRLHMEFTSDNGLTWERTSALNERTTGAIQPTILIHPYGKLQLLCRSTVSKILTAWSEDNGRNWSKLEPINLPNNNSGIDAVTLKDGRHIMIYNHLTKGRNMIQAAISDDGINWRAAVLLENDRPGTEFSYPAVIQTSDGLVHITYTWNRKQIKHVVLDPGRIIEKPFTGDEWPSE
ncbi:MAG TPA: sialidase [Bacteroidales bacterium]|nr:sialidase [Bacteroidales bacterium]